MYGKVGVLNAADDNYLQVERTYQYLKIHISVSTSYEEYVVSIMYFEQPNMNYL
jgi:hypothetical protein